jgi:hypothetical protein
MIDEGWRYLRILFIASICSGIVFAGVAKEPLPFWPDVVVLGVATGSVITLTFAYWSRVFRAYGHLGKAARGAATLAWRKWRRANTPPGGVS